MTREEQAALVAWLRGPGVVWSAVTEQLEEFGSVQTAAAEQAPAQGSLFEAARTDGVDEAARDLERWERAGIRMVCVLDAEYPSNLRMIHQHPPVLFMRGTADERDATSVGLLRIGREQGFLPPFFQKVNGQGIEVRIIAAQGTVITLIALLYAFIPSVSHAYWIFAAMATQVYLIMYVLMFIAAIKLRRSQPDHPRGYRAPALGLLCLLGAISSVAALVIGFIPPSQFGHVNPLTYAILILAGILAIGILPPLLMDRLRKPGWKAGSSGSAPQPAQER